MAEILRGKGIVSGIAVGKAKKNFCQEETIIETYIQGSIQEEKDKVSSALQAAKKELDDLSRQLKTQQLDSAADVMGAHAMMVDDPALQMAIEDNIAVGMSAIQALQHVCQLYIDMFEALDDDYMRQRATDVRDIGQRVKKHLLSATEESFEEPFVLCAKDMNPSMVAELPIDKLLALVLEQAGETSHSAIIAKSRGIVTICGVQNALTKINEGDSIIVDAYSGEVLLRPSNEQVAKYLELRKKYDLQKQQDLADSELPAVTQDGSEITIAANIGTPQDLDSANHYNAQGIGLYRSEFLFLGRSMEPTEDEQFEAYKAVVERCHGRCTIRTMDVGGDKPLRYLPSQNEANPFMGWRGIRVGLEHPELLVTQFKAILRSGVYGQVAIMLPMVTNVAEVQQAKQYLVQAKEELQKENKIFAKDIPFGIMIETPAAALQAEVLARECDFFSIGTNDLVQYTLAVDRGNSKVCALYDHFHPAVLKLIHMTVQAAKAHSIGVSVCGEMAADPRAVVLLLGMGIRYISMSPMSIPQIKRRINQMNLQRVENGNDHILEARASDEVLSILDQL